MNTPIFPDIKQSVYLTLIFVGFLSFFSMIFILLNNHPSLYQMLYYGFGACSALLVCYKVRKTESQETGFSTAPVSWKAVPFLVLSGMGCSVLGAFDPILYFLMHVQTDESIRKFIQECLEMTPDFMTFLTVVVIAPVVEELFFRGIILNGLLKRYSVVKAIVITTVLFALPHGFTALGILVLGSILGWVYYKSRNILLCILIHVAINLTAFAFLYWSTLYPDTSQVTYGVSDSPAVNVLAFIGLLSIIGGSVFMLNRILVPKHDKQEISESSGGIATGFSER